MHDYLKLALGPWPRYVMQLTSVPSIHGERPPVVRKARSNRSVEPRASHTHTGCMQALDNERVSPT